MPRRSTKHPELRGFTPREQKILRGFLRRYGERVVFAGLLAGQALGFDSDNPAHTERFLVLVQELGLAAEAVRANTRPIERQPVGCSQTAG